MQTTRTLRVATLSVLAAFAFASTPASAGERWQNFKAGVKTAKDNVKTRISAATSRFIARPGVQNVLNKPIMKNAITPAAKKTGTFIKKHKLAVTMAAIYAGEMMTGVPFSTGVNTVAHHAVDLGGQALHAVGDVASWAWHTPLPNLTVGQAALVGGAVAARKQIKNGVMTVVNKIRGREAQPAAAPEPAAPIIDPAAAPVKAPRVKLSNVEKKDALLNVVNSNAKHPRRFSDKQRAAMKRLGFTAVNGNDKRRATVRPLKLKDLSAGLE